MDTPLVIILGGIFYFCEYKHQWLGWKVREGGELMVVEKNKLFSFPLKSLQNYALSNLAILHGIVLLNLK